MVLFNTFRVAKKVKNLPRRYDKNQILAFLRVIKAISLPFPVAAILITEDKSAKMISHAALRANELKSSPLRSIVAASSVRKFS